MRLIVDANGLLYRSAFGLNLSTASGRQVGGVFGFLRGLERLLQVTRKPAATELIICWDGGYSARTAIYPDYKANRKRDPELVARIRDQRSLIVQLLSYLPVIQLWEDDIEADDIVGTVCDFAKHEAMGIVTHDKDLYQLATTRHTVLDFDGVGVELKMAPKRYLSSKVLIGDPSDNVKGIERVGTVTAAKMLDEHKTLKRVLKAYEPTGKIGGMVWSEAAAVVKRNLRLMKIGHLMTDAQRTSVLDQYRYGRKRVQQNKSGFRKKLMALEFTSLVSRLSGYLAPFNSLVHVQARISDDAQARAKRYRKRICETFAETGHTDGAGSVRRLRRPATGKDTSDGAHGHRRESGRTEADALVRRIRQEAPLGAPTYSKRIRVVGAVSASHGHGAAGVSGQGNTLGTRRGRTRSSIAGILDSPEVKSKRQLRRGNALSILSLLKSGDGWVWLIKQPTADLQFVSDMIDNVIEEGAAPSPEQAHKLEIIRERFLTEPPEWMGEGIES